MNVIIDTAYREVTSYLKQNLALTAATRGRRIAPSIIDVDEA